MANAPANSDAKRYVNSQNKKSFSVLLFPSILADIKIEVYNSRCEMIEAPFGAIVSAAAFLTVLRGLPLEAIEVEHCGKVTEVSFGEKYQTASLNVKKCKQLCSKTHIFADKASIDIKIMQSEIYKSVVAITECKDSGLFSESHLYELLLDEYNPDVACAYSEMNSEIFIKLLSIDFLPDVPILAALCALSLSEKRRAKRVLFDDFSFSIAPSYSGAVITIPTPKLMRFETPFL